MWKGPWGPAEAYVTDDVVSRNGSTYIALGATTGDAPESSPAQWSLMAQKGADGQDGADGTNGTNGTNGTDGQDGADGVNGIDGADGRSFVWKGAWDNSVAYEIDDVVSHAGATYIAVADFDRLSAAERRLAAHGAKGQRRSGRHRWSERPGRR